MTGITGRNEPRTRQGARLIRRGTLVARPPGEVPEGLALPLPLPLLNSRAPKGDGGLNSRACLRILSLLVEHLKVLMVEYLKGRSHSLFIW
jgi:hypothetical protein